MARIIGAADEFWRLRLSRVDCTTDVDFEWHDDILYREPRVRPLGELECWNVEAVRTDDYDVIVEIASFPEREEAETFYERACEDLSEMTKAQFEDSYLSSPGPKAPRDADAAAG